MSRLPDSLSDMQQPGQPLWRIIRFHTWHINRLRGELRQAYLHGTREEYYEILRQIGEHSFLRRQAIQQREQYRAFFREYANMRTHFK